MATMRACRSEPEYCRHSNRMPGLALQDAAEADCGCAAPCEIKSAIEGRVELNTFPTISTPAAASESERGLKVENADAGRAGASLGKMLAADTAVDAARRKRTDRMVTRPENYVLR